MSARGEDRKAAIVKAAIARIVAHGFEGLRVRDVASDVGINNATLHHHFATKTDLVAAIVRSFAEKFSIEGGVPAHGTAEERLAAYIAVRRNFMQRSPEIFFVLGELMVLARRDAEVARVMRRVQDGWRGHLVALCRDAGADPATALVLADRCRHELIGLGLEFGATQLIPQEDERPVGD